MAMLRRFLPQAVLGALLFVLFLLDPLRRGLRDRLAGTMVVLSPRQPAAGPAGWR